MNDREKLNDPRDTIFAYWADIATKEGRSKVIDAIMSIAGEDLVREPEDHDKLRSVAEEQLQNAIDLGLAAREFLGFYNHSMASANREAAAG